MDQTKRRLSELAKAVQRQPAAADGLADDIRALEVEWETLASNDRDARLQVLESRLSQALGSPQVYAPDPAQSGIAQSGGGAAAAAVAAILATAIAHPGRRLTVLGGLGSSIAGRLAAAANACDEYRFVFPSSSPSQHDMAPEHRQTRMHREGELKVLSEWRKALQRTDHVVAPAVQTFVSAAVGDTTILMVESDAAPVLIAWWSESMSQAMAAGEIEPVGTLLYPSSTEFERMVEHVNRVVEGAKPYYQHDVVAKLAHVDTVEDVLRPEIYATATAKLFARLDSSGRDYDRASGDEEGMPVALVLAHRHEDGNRKVLLQLRDPKNSDDAYGSYSLISSRLHAYDLIEAWNECVPNARIRLRDSGGEFPRDPADATGMLYDQLLGAFPVRPAGMAKFPIPLRAFQRAAQREVYSALGLQIEDQRLTHHPLELRESCVEDKNPPVFVELFSLRLKHDEVGMIRNDRPYAQVQLFRWPHDFETIPPSELNGFLHKAHSEGFIRSLIDRITPLSSVH